MALMSDVKKRQDEIAKLEAALTAPNKEVMIVRAKQIGLYSVKEEGRIGLAKNATAIAMHVGLPSLKQSSANKDTVEILEKLITLYSYNYLDSKDVAATQSLVSKEQAALVNLVELHRVLDKEAKNSLFSGNGLNQIHGYLPDITNPHKELKITQNEAEANEAKQLGFTLVAPLKVSGIDSSITNVTERQLWISDESVRERYVTGAMSTTNSAKKGVDALQGFKNQPVERYKALKASEQAMEKHLLAQAKKGDYEPAMDVNSIIPSYNEDGQVINLAYEMSSFGRDTLLERNNRFVDVLGAYAGSTFDKVESFKQNKLVADALKADFDANYAKDSMSYVRISKDSEDSRIVEAYAVMPKNLRMYMEEIFDGEIYVRNDVIDTVFGYAKYSIGSAFDKKAEARNAIEKFVVGMAEMFIPNNPKIKLMKFDRAWQEIVQLVKNIVVIRNLKTFIGNLHANMLILSTLGVNPITYVKEGLFALKAGMQHRKDVALLLQAKQKLKFMQGNPSKWVAEINRLEESINRNPLKDFLAAGMLPTIVEDLDTSNDMYSYKNKLDKKLSEYTKRIPDEIKTGAAWLFVSPGTPLYEFLNNATQYSDFVAKYLLYKHMTEKAKKKLSKEDALNLADFLFINYDVPTSKGLQALNDRGFVMFTKYYIRIQRALMYLFKEHPVTLLGQTAILGMMGSMTAIEPHVLLNLGNPFTVAPLNLPSALLEPIPIQLIVK